MKRKHKRDASFELRNCRFERQLLKVETDFGELDIYRMGHCTVYAGKTRYGWHLVISHPSRYPTWAEVMDARYHLVPKDTNMALILPPEQAFLEIYPNTFQLWEIKASQLRRPTNA